MVSMSWTAAANNFYFLLNDDYLTNVINATPPNISIYASRSFEFTYYKNPCTDSYSMAFWTWTEWEAHIDWMLLSNINLMLLPSMNEMIEYELYSKHYKMSDNELSAYFTGYCV